MRRAAAFWTCCNKPKLSELAPTEATVPKCTEYESRVTLIVISS